MLVAFDFDGALATSDPFVRLAEQHGTSGDVVALIDDMSTGDLDYEEGLRTVADRLAGLETDDAEAASDHLQVREGAPELLSALRERDHHVAVVSDAPERAIEATIGPALAREDTVVANYLPTANEALTGQTEGPLVGGRKDDVLKRIAAQQGRSLEDTVAVGDDRRDLPMLQAAETGVAVDPDPVVRAESDLVVPTVERLRLRFEEREVL